MPDSMFSIEEKTERQNDMWRRRFQGSAFLTKIQHTTTIIYYCYYYY